MYLCKINGVSFFYVVCENRYDMIVKFLLDNRVYVNLYEK